MGCGLRIADCELKAFKNSFLLVCPTVFNCKRIH